MNSDDQTAVASATLTGRPEPLCLWCSHFSMSIGSPGYSEYTPGSDFDMYCRKQHWDYERYSSEEHYRACVLTAYRCKDYTFNESLITEIQSASTPKRKP